MEMKSTTEGHTRATTTEQQDHIRRLNFSNPEHRETHIRVFLEWLPKMLYEAPGISWEHMPSQVMGYLIRNVADCPDAISITLATGCAMMNAMKVKVLYTYCNSLTKLLEQLRAQHGMTTLTQLRKRSIWEHFVKDRLISPGELNWLRFYNTFACEHLGFYQEGLTERQQVIWKPYLLPPLPRGFLDKYAQEKAVRKGS
jgi:hypothetical protein